MRITGKTGFFALFGSPVSHSASPAMYNYSFERLGLDYVYLAIDVKKGSGEELVRSARLFGLKGFNLTMPLKNEVLPFLDSVSPEASLVGAVNTVVNEDGQLRGYITDGLGFVDNLISKGRPVEGKRVTVIGSGGAGTAIQVELAKRGAKEVFILSRKEGFFDRALQTAEKIRELFPGVKIRVEDVNDVGLVSELVRESDILVNATIVGMKPGEGESPIKENSCFHKGLVVADCVYNPLETRFLREAREKGLFCVDGRGMLLHQGIAAFKLFTGLDMPVDEVRERFFS